MSQRTVTTRHRRRDTIATDASEAAPKDSGTSQLQARENPRGAEPVPAPPGSGGPKRREALAVSEVPTIKLDTEDLLAIAAMDPAELAALMDGAVASAELDIGQKVEGTVSRVGREDILIDIGGKAEGALERQEMPDAQLGDRVIAWVAKLDETGIRLSRRLSGNAALAMIEDAAASGAPIEGRVASRNQGGFEVRIGSVRAFCPTSHIARGRVPDDALDAFIGQTLVFQVLEADDRVLVSRRSIEEQAFTAAKDALWDGLAEGDLRDGTVRGHQPFGVFVDIGGADGLVPLREIDGDPATALPLGAKVRVRVLEIDRDNRRITLSARDPADTPWAQVGVSFVSGGSYDGVVARMTEFGAFVTLAPGLDGLVHRSKLAGLNPSPGDTLTVRLLQIDHQRQRLELAPVVAAKAADAAVEEHVRGVVAEVLGNGIVVQLDDGRTGWLPAHEVDMPAGTLLAQRFRRGRPVEGRVVSVDAKRQRVNLSTKSADSSEGDWRAAAASAPAGSFGQFAKALAGFKPKR